MNTPADLQWVGGVFDAGFQIHVRKDEHGDVEDISASVGCGEGVGQRLTEILGGGSVFGLGMLWMIPAAEQVAIFEQVLPFLRVQRDLVRRLLMYRGTLTPGRKVSDEVRKFRRELF